MTFLHVVLVALQLSPAAAPPPPGLTMSGRVIAKADIHRLDAAGVPRRNTVLMGDAAVDEGAVDGERSHPLGPQCVRADQ